MEDIEKLLEKSERLMERAIKKGKKAGEYNHDSYRITVMQSAIFDSIGSIYKQNKAIIELLKKYKK